MPKINSKGDDSTPARQSKQNSTNEQAAPRPFPVGEESGVAADDEESHLPVPYAAIRARYPAQREPVLDGLLRRGEVLNFNSHPKVGKSWIVYDLALAVARGELWLDKYETLRGRVLLIDNELHREELVYRIGCVAVAAGIDPDTIEDIDVLSLRGRLLDYAGLRKNLADCLLAAGYVLVIVDAHYRMLPDGISENGNAEMTAVYNAIDSLAAVSNAAWWLNHHTTKGNQSDKEITDVGAGAGAQSRAADTHLVLRPHKEDSRRRRVFVLDGVVRSFPPLDPACVKWEFPRLVPDDAFNPEILKAHGEDRRRAKAEDDKARVRKALTGKYETANAISGRVRMDRVRCHEILERLVQNGAAQSTRMNASGNPATGYRKSPTNT